MDRFGLAHRIGCKQDRLLDRLLERRTDAALGQLSWIEAKRTGWVDPPALSV